MTSHTQTAAAAVHTVIIGSYSKDPGAGLSVATFDDATGVLSPVKPAAGTPNPSFLALHPGGHFLYAANEMPVGHEGLGSGISAFRVEASGGLVLLGHAPFAGGPCFLSVDHSGKYLLAASYGNGTVGVFAIAPDGSLGERTGFDQHVGHGPVKGRQEGPHAHSAYFTPDNRHVLVVDLGIDRVVVYAFDQSRGTLHAIPTSNWVAEDGAGPRHIALDRHGKFAYVVNELANSVTTYRFHAGDGSAERLRSVSALPADFQGRNTAAEIVLSPDGHRLFVSNRGHDSLVTYNVDAHTGVLTLVGFRPSGGQGPRFFSLDPSGKWLLVAHQQSRNIQVFAVGTATEVPVAAGAPVALSDEPVCFQFLP